MNKQSGSAHIIIVAILAIGLIGALGFIFWQNFIQNNEEVSAKDSASVISDDDLADKETTRNTDETGLQIEEWGIKIPDASEFTATKLDQSDGSGEYIVYKISTATIGKEARALECPDDKLGYIVQVAANRVMDGDPRVRTTEKIGDYYYFYQQRSEVACAGVDGVGPEKLNSLMDEGNRIFPDLFVKTTSTD